MFRKICFTIGTLALAVASAANSYSLKLYVNTTINGVQLKPGDYKVELKENKAIFKQGKTIAETPVKIESTDRKIASTSVKYVNGAIQEISIGGTKTKLVLETNSGAPLNAAFQ